MKRSLWGALLLMSACTGIQETVVPDVPNQNAEIVTKADALSFVVSKDDLTNYCSFKTKDKNGNYVVKDVTLVSATARWEPF